MDIYGQPLLWHVIERVKAARTIDEVLVATTLEPGDAPLRRFLERQGMKMFLGEENDVLDRVYKAARNMGADVVVRITPDDPFKDPEIIDRAVRMLIETSPPPDYVANCSYDGSIPVSYPEGIDIEVMTFDCLERTWERADRPSERECLTPYVFRNPGEFKILGFEHTENLSQHRWTIDYERDLDFAREVYNRLYPRKPLFLMNDILDLLKAEPELSNINAGVERYEGYWRAVESDT